MTTARYRQLLMAQRSDVLTRQDNYPISDSLIDMMVERYAAKREARFMKAGLGEQRKFIIQLGKELDKEFRSMRDNLLPLFNDLGNRAGETYRDMAPIFDDFVFPTAETYKGMSAPIAKVGEAEIGDVGRALVRAMMKSLNVQTWQTDAVGPLFEETTANIMNGTTSIMKSHLGIFVDMPDPVMRRVIADGGRRVGLLDLEGQTRKSLFEALHEGRSEGEGIDDLVKRIQQHVSAGRYKNAGAEYRATMIARTETKHAQNVSTLEAYRAAASVTGVRAFDNQTGYDDEDCILRNQTIYTFDEAQREMELEHPNGTLTFAPEVEDSLA